MQQKNEYLYSLGTRLLLINGIGLKDTIEIVNDYSENIDTALDEGLGINEIKVKLGTPKEVSSALGEEKVNQRLFFCTPAAILAILLSFFIYLMFRSLLNLGIPLFIFVGFSESIAAVIICALMWIFLRINGLSYLLALKKTDRKENLNLILLNLPPALSVMSLYAVIIYLQIDFANITSDKKVLIGPAVMTLLCTALCINLIMMVIALQHSIRQSPRYLSIFIHSLGAIGFLLAFHKLLISLTNLEMFWKALILCAFPYAIGIILAAITLLFIRSFHKRGETIWMHR